jgi:flagellar FliL protein
MATEKELQLDTSVEPKSNKKLIIIIVAVVLVVAIGVAAALILMGGDDAPAEEVSEEAVAEEDASASSLGPAIYIKLKPEFIVNYQVGTRQRYLQIYMEAMTRNAGIAEALEMHSPMIRSAIITLLSQQSYEYLRTAEGRADIRIKLQTEIQRLLTQETGIQGGLEQILFTNYVMQ